MGTNEFKIVIDAPREKVWSMLWEDAKYREWTSVFAEGSHAITDWKKGSKVLFLDEKKSGMVSLIKENKPNEFMSFQHMGEVKNGVEDLDVAKQQGWAGAFENYTLELAHGKTQLCIEISTEGMPQNMLDYFADTWPKALKKLKEMSEKN